MSLPEFQRALTDVVASPELCRAAAADASRLTGEYDLTERELKRLLHSAPQPGMKVRWSLHRANRFGPMQAILPLTCRALGPHLRRELDAFWNGELPEDVQFKSEAGRFASFLRRRLSEGRLDLPVLNDLVSFELAMAELRFMPQRQIRETLVRAETLVDATTLILHPFIRLLLFQHDPERLLASAIGERPVPSDLTRGDYHLLVDGKDGGMAIRLLDARLANILNAFNLGVPPFLDESEVKVLLKAGLIARWPHKEASVLRETSVLRR
jgi:hypothetical protein